MQFYPELLTGAAAEEMLRFGVGGACPAADGVEIGGEAGAVATAVVAEEIVGEECGRIIVVVGALSGDLGVPLFA